MRFVIGEDNIKNSIWGAGIITLVKKNLRVLAVIQTVTFTSTYWSTDDNKISDVLGFFITNGISPKYIKVHLRITVNFRNSNNQKTKNTKLTPSANTN